MGRARASCCTRRRSSCSNRATLRRVTPLQESDPGKEHTQRRHRCPAPSSFSSLPPSVCVCALEIPFSFYMSRYYFTHRPSVFFRKRLIAGVRLASPLQPCIESRTALRPRLQSLAAPQLEEHACIDRRVTCGAQLGTYPTRSPHRSLLSF